MTICTINKPLFCTYHCNISILWLGKSAPLPEIIKFHSQTCQLISVYLVFKSQLYLYLHWGKACILYTHIHTLTHFTNSSIVSPLCFQHALSLSKVLPHCITLCYDYLFISLSPLNAMCPLMAKCKSSSLWQSLLPAALARGGDPYMFGK